MGGEGESKWRRKSENERGTEKDEGWQQWPINSYYLHLPTATLLCPEGGTLGEWQPISWQL